MATYGLMGWSDPPDPNDGRWARKGVWHERLQPLIDDPYRWGQIGEGAAKTLQVTASVLRQGKYHMPDGEWDFVARPIDDETWGLWGRYLGPAQDLSG